MPAVTIGRGSLDVRVAAAEHGAQSSPPLVFLHEGLGSIELWRSFPDDVRAACGGPMTIVYSRHGYGRSAAVDEPLATTYMHDEALLVLPELLAALGVDEQRRPPILIGHSDGASIAIIHAGAGHRLSGLVLLAPHVFVEDRSIAGIVAARDAYRTGDLRAKLARYHDDADATFWGWNDIWLSRAFRSWDITSFLPPITAPTLAIQGADDEYGTIAQLDAIAAGSSGPVERVVIPGAGHTLHSGPSAPTVIDAIARFVGELA